MNRTPVTSSNIRSIYFRRF